MRSKFACSIIALALLSGCLAASQVQAAVPNSQVGTPNFKFKNGTSQLVGKCFGLQWFNHRNLLIAPLHLLAPTATRRTAVTQAQLNTLIDHVDVLDLTGTRVVETARRSLLRRNIASNEASSTEPGDLMAFELPARSRLAVLGISPQAPRSTERVTILTYDFKPRNREPWPCKGSVFESDANYFIIQMDQPLSAMSSDGAPVVNQNNQLIGMMIGPLDATRMHIRCIPATAIYARLLAEVGH